MEHFGWPFPGRFWPIASGSFRGSTASESTFHIGGTVAASFDARPGGGVVVARRPNGSSAATSHPPGPQQASTLLVRIQASEWSVFASSDSGRTPNVTDAGTLVGWRYGDQLVATK